jgi:hypothetical protein
MQHWCHLPLLHFLWFKVEVLGSGFWFRFSGKRKNREKEKKGKVAGNIGSGGKIGF